jgi:N-acetylglucosaminyl-diphospho-decaprenol L-rhamnosyltransferase
MGERRVTVVVITHNRCEELDRTLRSLEGLPEDPPIIVVDNDSSDETCAMVRSRHPAVTLVAAEANLGAVGRNVGVELAETPFVAFCDDDTWYDAGALSFAADLLEAHPTLAVVTASIMVEPRGVPDPICEEMASSPLPRPPGLPGYPLLSFLAGVSVVRRSAYLAAGGFSERLWLGGEEELLASDLVRSGWHLAYVPEVVAHHHASKLRDADLRRRHGIRNTLWFTWLRRPLTSSLRRTVRLLRRLPRDRVSAYGVLEAIGGAVWVLRERDVVPAHIEEGYRLLEESQLNSNARRYVS